MAFKPEVCFRDALSFAIGGGWGQEEATAKESELVRVIRGTDIPSVNARYFREVPTRYETPSKVEKRRLRSGDIVLEISGGSSSKGQPTGRTVFIDDEVLDGLAGTAIPASFCRLVRVNAQKVLPKFAYYWLQEMYVSGRAFAYESQSTGISNFQFERFLDAERLTLPSMSTQEEIVAVLSPIEARQRLLRQTNATLESIAQAVFKSWFIDFDPVRAKAEGREPEGMDAATAALFPTQFEESALGLIPKGWGVARLGDMVELAYGKALKATDRRPGGVPVYGSGGITGYHDVALVEHASVVVGRKGTVGALYWEDAPFFPIDTTFYVKPKMTPLTFCFYAMQRLGLEHMNTDAAVPGLNRENAYRLEVLRPIGEVLGAFDELVGPLREAMRTNGVRANTLVQLRDSLLPRLISGKLRLPEAQAQLEEAIA